MSVDILKIELRSESDTERKRPQLLERFNIQVFQTEFCNNLCCNKKWLKTLKLLNWHCKSRESATAPSNLLYTWSTWRLFLYIWMLMNNDCQKKSSWIALTAFSTDKLIHCNAHEQMKPMKMQHFTLGGLPLAGPGSSLLK